MADKMLWNKSHTDCVRASKIRSISIYPRVSWVSPIVSNILHAEVKGWYNSNESFDFGWFNNEAEAQQFVNELNRQIEGG